MPTPATRPPNLPVRRITTIALPSAAESRTVAGAEWSMLIGGHWRRFLVFEPAVPSERPAPLILDLHGSGLGMYDQFLTSGSLKAVAAGAIVVVPQGAIPFRLFDGWPLGWSWNVPGTPLTGETEVRPDLPDDIGFLDAVLDAIAEYRNVDPLRVHAMGFSAGGRLAASLVRDVPGRIASIACIAGLVAPPGLPETDVAVLGIHGRLDTLNPYDGAAGPRWPLGVEASATKWATAHGCRPDAFVDRVIRPGVRERSWTAAATQPVVLLTVGSAGHCWPGTADLEHVRRFGESRDVAATDVALQFFARHRRPSAVRVAADFTPAPKEGRA